MQQLPSVHIKKQSSPFAVAVNFIDWTVNTFLYSLKINYFKKMVAENTKQKGSFKPIHEDIQMSMIQYNPDEVGGFFQFT